MRVFLEIDEKQIERIRKESDQWKTTKAKELKKVIKRSAQNIKKGAEQNAWPHRRSGDMAESISVHQKYSGARQDVRVGKFYGWFVEHGTSRMRARPFLRPAIQDEEPNFVAEIKKELDRK
jgi:HK97 gp10 family phage protein